MDCTCEHCKLDRIIALLDEQGKAIMALADDLAAVTAQVTKAKGEVLAKISDLETQLGGLRTLVEESADAVAELDAAEATVADLKAAAQSMDDVVPDQPPA